MAFDLSEDQLESTEADVGAVFPQSYRQRMMRSNGGEVFANVDYWNLIPIRNKSERKRLSRTASHVLAETKSFSEWSIWHDNAYVIAENETGDPNVPLTATIHTEQEFAQRRIRADFAVRH